MLRKLLYMCTFIILFTFVSIECNASELLTKEKNYVYYEINTTVFDELIIWVNQFGGKKR